MIGREACQLTIVIPNTQLLLNDVDQLLSAFGEQFGVDTLTGAVQETSTRNVIVTASRLKQSVICTTNHT